MGWWVVYVCLRQALSIMKLLWKFLLVPVGINEWLESHNIHNHWRQISYYYSTRVESDGVGWSGTALTFLFFNIEFKTHSFLYRVQPYWTKFQRICPASGYTMGKGATAPSKLNDIKCQCLWTNWQDIISMDVVGVVDRTNKSNYGCQSQLNMPGTCWEFPFF